MTLYLSKQDIQRRIDFLTRTLKDISPQDPTYPKLWDERVDLKWKLIRIEAKENNDHNISR